MYRRLVNLVEGKDDVTGGVSDVSLTEDDCEDEGQEQDADEKDADEDEEGCIDSEGAEKIQNEAAGYDSDSSDGDIEVTVPKNPNHSFCRLCPEVLLKSADEVEAHVKSTIHIHREARYHRTQRAFNARHFGITYDESEEEEILSAGVGAVKEEKREEGKGQGTTATAKSKRRRRREPTEDGTAIGRRIRGHVQSEGIENSSEHGKSQKSEGATGPETIETEKKPKKRQRQTQRKNLSEERIQELKAKFQAKKTRRLARKSESTSVAV